MGVLILLLGIPVLALILRATGSADPRWMRWLGLAVAAVTAGLVPAVALLHWQLSSGAGIALLALAPIYLVAWAMVSRDPAAHRLVSLVAALPSAFAIFILYMSIEHYTE